MTRFTFLMPTGFPETRQIFRKSQPDYRGRCRTSLSKPTKLVIWGTLDVRGAASLPVRFSRLNTSPYPIDYTYNSEAWGGIWLTETCHATIDHAVIEGARDGIDTFYTGDRVTIRNSIIRHNFGDGIYVYSDPDYGDRDQSVIRNNLIEYNDGAGILVQGNARPRIGDGNIVRYNGLGIITAYNYNNGPGNPAPINQRQRHLSQYLPELFRRPPLSATRECSRRSG